MELALPRLALALAGMTLALHANGAQGAQIVTLQDAIDIALERNDQVREAQVSVGLADVDVEEARKQFLPTLSLNAGGTHNFGRGIPATGESPLGFVDKSASVNLSSGLTLFNGFHDLATVHRAKRAYGASQSDLRFTEQTVIFTVVENFVALMERQDELRVERDNLAAQVKLEQQIQLYVDAGAREVAVLYQQQANVAAARLAVVQGQNAVESGQVDVMHTLQLDPAETYEFEAPPFNKDNFGDSPELASLVRLALDQRPDLKAEQARLEAAKQDVRVADSAFWPTLSLNADYGGLYSSLLPSGVGEQLGQQRVGTLSLNLSIPLIDRGNALDASHRAQLNLRSAAIKLDAAREEVGLQIRRVYQDYAAARERFSVAQIQEQSAQRAIETSEERFRSGVTSLVEVTQARSIYLQAALALVAARANLLLQRLSMKYYVGDFGREKPVYD
jgi:outer membrane protein